MDKVQDEGMTQTSTATAHSVTVEIMDGASRCRQFTARGRQCGNYTKRVVISATGHRSIDCGKH